MTEEKNPKSNPKPMDISSVNTKDMLKRLESFSPQGQTAHIHTPSMTSYYDEGAKSASKDAVLDRFKRQAGEGAFFSSSGPNVGRTPLMYTDIMLDPLLLFFPKDRLDEVNKRFRRIYETHFLVGRIMDLHSEFPLSDFELKCDDPEITHYYNDFKERVDLVNLCRQMLLEFHLLGEANTYGNWDYNNFEWSDFTQIPPENIDVYGSYISSDSLCFLKPDANLRQKLTQSKMPDQALTKMWDQQYVEDLKANRPHLLDNKRLIRFVRNPNKYTLRGVSLVWRVLHDVLYELKLKMLQLTKADRGMFPIKIFKLGSPEKGWIPSKRHFDAFRAQLVAAANDPDYNIIYHFGVNVDYVGTSDKWADLTPEFEAIERRIMIGLFANEAVVSGSDTTYASGAVSVRVLMQKYLAIRTLLEKAIIYKMFVPLAKARGFVRRTKAELNHKVRINSNIWGAKEMMRMAEARDIEGVMRISNSVTAGEGNVQQKYYLPNMIWEKMNLLDNTTIQRYILDLREREEIPFDTVCDVFGWDKQTLNNELKSEIFTIRNPKVKDQILDFAGKDKEIMIKILRGEDFDKVASAVAEKLEKELIDETEKEKNKKKKETEKEDEEALETTETSPTETRIPRTEKPAGEERSYLGETETETEKKV